MSKWNYPSNQVVPSPLNGTIGDIPKGTSNHTSARIESHFPKRILILSSIVILIIIVAIIAVPLTLVLTFTGPFSTVSSNNSFRSTAVSTTVSTTIVTTVSFPSQCSSYTTISDSTRLSTASGGSSCDSSLFTSNPIWIRFTNPGGNQISTSVVSSNQCGTQATGWYNGSMPSSGLTINGTVCYQWNSNTCNWSNQIQITNCASFYVYALIAPPACNLRYCTV